jgi:hypothetical protein
MNMHGDEGDSTGNIERICTPRHCLESGVAVSWLSAQIFVDASRNRLATVG